MVFGTSINVSFHGQSYASELDGRDFKKQGCHETVMAATIALTLNARRGRTDPHTDLRSATYPFDTVYSNCGEFGKPALDIFLGNTF